MDQSDFFAVENDRLHQFVTRDELGDAVISALQHDLAKTVGETVLPIAHWENDRTGPLSVALNAAGELVVVMMGNSFADQGDLISAISTLEQWLAPMDMRDLGELSGNPRRFIDGLWELNPRTPLNLASFMRVLLINPAVDPDPEVVRASIPFSRVDVLWLEALEAGDGTIAVRRTNSKPSEAAHVEKTRDAGPHTLQLDHEPAQASTVEDGSPEDDILLLLDDDTAFEAESVFADTAPPETTNVAEPKPAPASDREIIDLTVDEIRADGTPVVDDIVLLDEPSPQPTSVTAAPIAGTLPTIIRGSSYVTAELPLHFDASASRIEPICDELFAVGPHLVLVVDIDDQDETPIETASIFRWETVSGKRQLFDLHALDSTKRRRTVHIFVEGGSQPNRVFYVGTGKLLTQTDRSGVSGLWFKLDAPLDARPAAILQAGRLPSMTTEPAAGTFSFASPHPGPPVPPGAPAHEQRPNWVPNV